LNLNTQPQIKDNKAIYTVDDFNLPTYQDFIQIRSLPSYKVIDNRIIFPANYLDESYLDESKLPLNLTHNLFDYQQVIVKVAFLKRKYAIFADAGLGKTLIMGELARQLHSSHKGKILFCIPLNIIRQFEEMCQDFFPDFPEFIHLHNHKWTLEEWCAWEDVPRIGFINHEAFIKSRKLSNIDAFFLDESSILKGGAGGVGKIAKHLVANTKGIPYKFAASATPAPNDRVEYAMVAMFLEQVNSEKEFYSLFFTIKDDVYVLKRHATEAFYRYLSTFSIFIRNPAAYGFEDNLKGLLPWEELHERIEMTHDQLEAIERWSLKGRQRMLPGAVIKPRSLAERGKFSQVSKGFFYLNEGIKTITYVDSNKPRRIAEIVQSHLPEQVIVWVVFDTEGDIIQEELSKIGIESTHITGKVKPDDRVELIEQFRHGELQVVISKPRILGFGLNFQFCRIAVFSGLNDSYEQYYQAVKRIHRYGQDRQVLIYHIYTSYEEVILYNVLRKQEETLRDFDYQEKLYINSLYHELKQFLEMEDYRPMETQVMTIEPVLTDKYQLRHGDSLKILTDIATNEKWYDWIGKDTVDFSVFSPPFMGDVFTYSNDPADMGNTRGAGAYGGLDEFMLQFQFFLRGMLAVTKPGRLMAMHLEDVPLRKSLDGHMGLFDFVGEAIRQANEAGWILLAKIPIIKNQQMTAIVKKVSSLAMGNMETDRLRIAPCQNGYLVLFRKPGEANIKVADLARCNDCKWEGYAKDLNNWQPDRGYKSNWLLEANMTCPSCGSSNLFAYKEMNGNKWIMLAEGAWPDHPDFNGNKLDDYDSIAKKSQSKRWYDLITTALGVWPDINEPDTLHNNFTNDEEDADKHLCPLPKEIARRAIELYTLPGETVFTPFAGIGTEVDAALRLNRKAIGIELKPEYFMQAVKNADLAIMESQQMTLFDLEALKV
jgi:hypothetical protein